MLTISNGQFNGTSSELIVRVDAFKKAIEDHKLTVGEPAPREDDLIENIVRSGGVFQIEAEIVHAEPTPQERQTALVGAVQRYLDSRAAERGYDDILSAVSYATSTNARFGLEGVSYRNWRDAVWVHCYSALADVQANLRAIPTAAELIDELPKLVIKEAL